MIHVLILDLKTNNDEALFISSGASFHILGPRLVIVSVPKALKALLCILLIFMFEPLLCHIQINGQKLNCGIIKVLNKIRFLCCDKYCEILDNACSFLLAFRHSALMLFKSEITIDGNL